MARGMKLLVVHNHYQQVGGEDREFAAETALLEARGHEVLRYTVHNDRIADMGRFELAKATLWNRENYRELRSLVRRERPQVAHFHNTFPLISPAGYYAARAEGVPVVQTLQNYRLLCPNALFFRDGGVCEDCLGKAVPWPGMVHACYRDSNMASGAVAAMLATHRALGTWKETVDVYLALTEFHRRKLVQGGLPEEKVMVKPNFVYPDPGTGEGGGDYALFVGRLSPEKGLETLLGAWKLLGEQVPLKIAGDGPEADRVAEASRGTGGVEWLGAQPREQIVSLMKDARALIFPSVWYEGLPVVITEAYAAGLPVIASNLGNMSTVVEHGRTGLHFRPGDPEDLAARVEWAWSHPVELAHMRGAARAEFEAKYTAERNYQMLMECYEMARKRREGGVSCP
jgi:glycosyltransferase involved in cell wall biosynthesis